MASEHNITKPVADPGDTVNEAVVQRKFTFLSGEISYPVRHKGLSGRQRLGRGGMRADQRKTASRMAGATGKSGNSADGIVVAPACNGLDMMT